MTLVEKALEHNKKEKKPITQEMKDLAILWLKGEITTTQVSVALTGNSTHSVRVYSMALALRELYKEGKITIK